MPQFGFYLAGAAVAGAGRLGLLLAWDPTDRGPDAADDIDLSDIALYSWVGPLPAVTAQAGKIKSAGPITIPADNCPLALDDPTHDYVLRFGVKSGGTGASLVVDGWLEVFEGNQRVYGATQPTTTMKINLAEGSSVSAQEMSMQDRVGYQALEDPPDGDVWTRVLGGATAAKDIWRELLSPGVPLAWV
jgi:hypothetical protein